MTRLRRMWCRIAHPAAWKRELRAILICSVGLVVIDCVGAAIGIPRADEAWKRVVHNVMLMSLGAIFLLLTDKEQRG